MSAQGTPPVPAGWYPDPEQPTRGRYWDGAAWTQNYHDPAQATPPQLKAPEGTDWNTVWIWLIVGIQVLPLITLLLVPWGSMFDVDLDDPRAATSASFSIFLSPFYWLTLVLSWAVYGLSAFFAYRDHRELGARGVPRPFHWAFVFLGGIVYAIGRSVVVHRRTGKGHAPIWAEAAYVLLSFVAVGVIMAIMLDGMVDMITSVSRYR